MELTISYLWYPFKRFGTRVILLSKKGGLLLWLLLLLGAGVAYAFKTQVSGQNQDYVAIFLAAIALAMVLKAFAERENALHAWQIALLSQLFTILSILWNAPVEMKQILLYTEPSLRVVCGVESYQMTRAWLCFCLVWV